VNVPTARALMPSLPRRSSAAAALVWSVHLSQFLVEVSATLRRTPPANPGWAASTVSHTRSIIDCHPKPHPGHLGLAKLTTADIDDFYAHLLRAGGRDHRPLARTRGPRPWREVRRPHLVPPVGGTPRASRVQNAGVAPSHL
jgi:hypothetical protein